MKEDKETIVVRLPKGLRQKVKIYCAERSIKIQEFVEKALKSELKK